MIIEHERTTYDDTFDYFYDHLGNNPTVLVDDSNNDFREFLWKRSHFREK